MTARCGGNMLVSINKASLRQS